MRKEEEKGRGENKKRKEETTNQIGSNFWKLFLKSSQTVTVFTNAKKNQKKYK